MLRNFWIAGALFVASHCAHASIVTIEFAYNITKEYSYAAEELRDIEPLVGTGSFSFNIDDYVLTGYTHDGEHWTGHFGFRSPTRWVSPTTPRIPLDPYSGAYGELLGSGLEVFVSDQAAGHLEFVGVHTTHSGRDGRLLTSHSIGLGLFGHVEPQARTDGESVAQSWTKERVLELLQELQRNQTPVEFVEYYEVFEYFVGAHEGVYWGDPNARITRVVYESASIAAPSGTALLLGGFGAMCMARRRRGVPRSDNADRRYASA